MLFRLNPSKLLFKLGIQESALPAIVICAKRLTLVLRLLKDQNIAANFLNPRRIDDCKTLFSFLNWNPISNEIEIDSDGLFEYFLKNSTKPKEIRSINDDFVKRLKSTKLPDVFRAMSYQHCCFMLEKSKIMLILILLTIDIMIFTNFRNCSRKHWDW